MTAAASAAPVQRNEKTMPQQASSAWPTRSAPSEGEEQEVAGHDRRQDEGQVHEAVEHGAAREAAARQRVGGGERERQARQGRPRATFRLSRTAIHSSGVRFTWRP